jgi:hypothetical protein
MTIEEAIDVRHSCRSYSEALISGNALTTLRNEIEQINMESGLHIQLMLDEPGVFNGFVTWGTFHGARNYLAMVGPKKDGKETEIKIGYYGERLVLLAVTLGMQCCWVKLTYAKSSRVDVKRGEHFSCAICIGYPAPDAKMFDHKTKTIQQLCDCSEPMPDWFRQGMVAVQKAPSSTDKQPVLFHLGIDRQTVTAEYKPTIYSFPVDLGIAKYHFEIGSGGHKVL